MKRSEMLKVIEKTLESFEIDLEHDHTIVAADILLDIEKAGMIEPRIKGSYELYGINVYRENNYWEEEDE